MQLRSVLGVHFRVSEMGARAIVLVIGCGWQVRGQSPSTPGVHGTPELRAFTNGTSELRASS